MRLLDRLRQWVGDQESEQSVQYELLRMTIHGGWEKPGHATVEGSGEIDFASQREKPETDDDFPIHGFPGRYRFIQRLDSDVWTYETDDAAVYYERERQRQTLNEMSFEEVEHEYFEGSGQLDELDYHEIEERYYELRENEQDRLPRGQVSRARGENDFRVRETTL